MDGWKTSRPAELISAFCHLSQPSSNANALFHRCGSLAPGREKEGGGGGICDEMEGDLQIDAYAVLRMNGMCYCKVPRTWERCG